MFDPFFGAIVRRSLLGLVAFSCVIPSCLSAQAAWDGPSLVSPHSPGGLSVMLVSNGPGDALGAMAHWGSSRGAMTLGYRGGVVQNDADRTSVFAGVDVSGVLARSVEDADLQVSWWSGAGVGVGDEVLVSVPLGLVVGWQGLGDGTVFAPYAGAHVALDLASGEGDTASLDASVDLGLDLTLTSGWVVRFGASLFGRESLGLGIRVPS